MVSLRDKTDGQLEREYSNTKDRKERREIAKVLEDRGKEHRGMMGWQDKPKEEEPYDEPFDYENVPAILGFLQGIAAIFLMWQTWVLFAIAWFAYRLIQYPLTHYFEIAEKYFPTKYYMEGNIIGNKIQMNIVGFMVACGVTIVLFKLGKDVRKIAALVFALMSIYFLVDEIRTKDVPVSAIILSGLVILIALSGVVKIKKCFLLGIWMIVTTTFGFIIIGNHVLTPWVFIETAGFLLVFMKGNVIYVAKRSVKSATGVTWKR
ncbi:hypothetical protein [Bacillus bombysepticus]|uniref:hypothetical protein n=1 Tax=Bacillus bombysepticus TaxID=658666 RepID=UPI003018D140